MNSKKTVLLILLALALLLGTAEAAYRLLIRGAAEPEAVVSEYETAPDISPEHAADFTVQDWDGNETRLTEHLGRPVILNFWASWCPPCKEELPLFESAYQTYGDRIDFMMVDLTDGVRETENGAKAYVTEQGYTFPVYFDSEGSAVNAYQLYSIPQTAAVDEDGRILSLRVGMLTEDSMGEMIKMLLD